MSINLFTLIITKGVDGNKLKEKNLKKLAMSK